MKTLIVLLILTITALAGWNLYHGKPVASIPFTDNDISETAEQLGDSIVHSEPAQSLKEKTSEAFDKSARAVREFGSDVADRVKDSASNAVDKARKTIATGVQNTRKKVHPTNSQQ